MMKISFIVPVYKVEQYLTQCAESLLAQTYKDFELLLVDDGSPDGCPALCDELEKKDNRIKALHKPNGGLSDARNYGLLHAKGEYVAFIDGDDFWQHDDNLEKLIKIADENAEADFIGFNCDYFYPGTNRFVPWVKYADVLLNIVDHNTALFELVKSGTFPMSACLKLMKREFLVNNELFFVKGQISEDIPWFINVLEKSKKCIFTNQYVYAYRQNVEGSITRTGGKRSFNSILHIVESEVERVQSRNLNTEAKKALLSFLAYELCILMSSKDVDKDEHKRLHKLKWLLEYDINPKVKRVKRYRHILGLPITIVLLKLYNNRRRCKH